MQTSQSDGLEMTALYQKLNKSQKSKALGFLLGLTEK